MRHLHNLQYAQAQPKVSLFQFLLFFENDRALINFTRFIHWSFRYPLTLSGNYYRKCTACCSDGSISIVRCFGRGSSKHLSAVMSLGMFLAWHKPRCQWMTFWLIFGVTISIAPLLIRFASPLE